MTTDDTPASARSTSFAGKLLALLGVLASCAYLANLGAGVLGEIPDIIPGAGNLDEVFFSALLIVCLHFLGIHMIPGSMPKQRLKSHTEAQSHRE